MVQPGDQEVGPIRSYHFYLPFPIHDRYPSFIGPGCQADGFVPDRNFGIKDSTIDPQIAKELGERFGKDLLTFTGTDSLFDLALEQAASGCITAMANLRSLDLRCVWDARQQGHVDQAANLRLERSREVIESLPTQPVFI